MFIGMTERGDAGLNLSWYNTVKNNSECAGAILITKNPNKNFIDKVIDLMKYKPVITHITITGWGGTQMEPNVPSAKTVVEQIKELMAAGFPAKNIVLRIDPIIPNEEGLNNAKNVIRLRNKEIPEVKRIRISIYDDYHTAREEMIKRGYEPIDGMTKWKNEMERRPSKSQVYSVINALLNVDSSQIYELCAEPELQEAHPHNFRWSGCLSKEDCDIMNITIPDGIGVNGQNRFGCRCLMMKKELLNDRAVCPHNCAYCYWRR